MSRSSSSAAVRPASRRPNGCTGASIRCLLVEARPRLGGRAWTVHDSAGHALDLGCGWLHSADRNPWVGVAQAEGLSIDKTPPPWMNRQLERSFPRAEFADYRKAFTEFYERLDEAAQREPDAPASTLLDPASRWNPLMNATSTYISGAELDRISLKDLDRYHSTDVNWRVIEGYGTLISKHGAALQQMLDCPVSAIDHSGKRLRVDTGKGAIAADQVIVTVPSAVLAAERIGFTPSLPEKIEAARGLPLGVDDKLFIALDGAEEFETSVRVFGHTDRVATAGYHLRPFGWPIIECYFGGIAPRSWNRAVWRRSSILPCPSSAACSATISPAASSRSACMAGATIRSRSAHIPMHRPASPIAGRRSRSRSTTGCFSPAKPVRGMISRPRMVAISPASPRPSR